MPELSVAASKWWSRRFAIDCTRFDKAGQRLAVGSCRLLWPDQVMLEFSLLSVLSQKGPPHASRADQQDLLDEADRAFSIGSAPLATASDSLVCRYGVEKIDF